jgi:putative transposase
MTVTKAEEAGRRVILVNPRNTSKLCSSCGEIVPKALSVRVHACPVCGLVMGRDHNAALNMLQRGLLSFSP